MRKVAIIEDAEDNRDLLYYLLRDEYEVLQYGTGGEALQELPANPPDLIVMDIWLPDMDGIELLTRIRQDSRLRGIPILALTAHAMAGDQEKYLSAGFDQYASKPITNIDRFLLTLRNLLSARI
jgi:two-component system, cell cycle response regulator DivK